MSYGSEIEAAVEGMIEAALENFDPDIENQIESWFYNSVDIEDQVHEAIRYGAINADDIDGLYDSVNDIVTDRLENLDVTGTDVADEVAALRADLDAIKDTIGKIARVLSEPTAVVSLDSPVPAFENQMTIDQVVTEDDGYEAPYTTPSEVGLNI